MAAGHGPTTALAVTLGLLLCSLVAPGAADDPVLDIPGSCAADVECGVLAFCNDDGICTPIGSGGIPPTHKFSSSATVMASVLGAVGLFVVVFFSGCLTAGLTSWHCDRWNPNEDQRMARIMVISLLCCCALGLGIGIPMGIMTMNVTPAVEGAGTNCSSFNALACAPFYCDMRVELCFTSCEIDDECTEGASCTNNTCVAEATETRESDLPPWVAIITSLGGGCCCFVCFQIIRCCTSEWNGDRRCCAALMSVVCLVVVGLTLGLSLGLPHTYADIESTGGHSPVNTTACRSNGPCLPYYCDLAVGQCNDRCELDSDCADSFACNQTSLECVRETSGEKVAMFSVGAVFGISGASMLVCFVITFGFVFGIADYEKFELGCFWGCCCCIFVGLAVAFSIGFLKTDVDSFLRGDGAACAVPEAVACEPYMCDLVVNHCYTNCSADSQCMGETECSDDGACVPKDVASDLRALATPAQATLFTIGFSVSVSLAALFYGVYWTDKTYDCSWDLGFNGKFCAGLALVVIPLSLGLVFGLVRVPTGDPATDPSAQYVLVEYLPRFWAVSVPLAATVVACLVGALVIRCCLDIPWTADHNTWEHAHEDKFMFTCLAYIAVVFCVGLLVGAPLAMIRTNETPDFVGGNMTECVGLDAVQCFPYYCDLGTASCYDRCSSDAHCVDESYVCSDEGACIAAIRDYPLLVGVVATVVAGTCLACCGLNVVCWGSQRGCRSRRPIAQLNGTRLVWVLAAAFFFAVMSTGVVLVPVVQEQNLPFPSDAGVGAACLAVDDVTCLPYFCDTRVARCLSACSNSRECTQGYRCSDGGVCEAGEPQLPYIAAGLLTTVVVLVMCYVLYGPAVRRIQMQRAAERRRLLQEEFRRQLEAFEEQQRNVQQAVLDVDPVANYKTDPTQFSPAALRSVDFPATADVEGGMEERICAVCFALPATVRFAGKACQHGFCDGCASQSLAAILDTDQFPAACPGCLAEEATGVDHDDNTLIQSEVIERLVRRAVVTLQFARRFINLQIMKAFNSDDIITCPSCGVLSVCPDMTGKSGRDIERSHVECHNCATEFCSLCNAHWFDHQGMSCADFDKARARGTDRITERLIAATSKPCPNCSAPITHYRGHHCHHIMPGSGCPSCGHHFCYVCLLPNPCPRDGHALFCDENCDCPTCPTCKPGAPCPHCSANESCPACYPPNPPPPVQPVPPDPIAPEIVVIDPAVNPAADPADLFRGFVWNAVEEEVAPPPDNDAEPDLLELLTGGRNMNLEAFLAEQAQIMAGLQGGGGGGGNGDGMGAEVNFDEILQALRGDGGDDNQDVMEPAPRSVSSSSLSDDDRDTGERVSLLAAIRASRTEEDGERDAHPPATTSTADADGAGPSDGGAGPSTPRRRLNLRLDADVVAQISDERARELAGGVDGLVFATTSGRMELRTPTGVQQQRTMEFQMLTGATAGEARDYLGMFNWDVDSAYGYWVEANGGEEAVSSRRPRTNSW